MLSLAGVRRIVSYRIVPYRRRRDFEGSRDTRLYYMTSFLPYAEHIRITDIWYWAEGSVRTLQTFNLSRHMWLAQHKRAKFEFEFESREQRLYVLTYLRNTLSTHNSHCVFDCFTLFYFVKKIRGEIAKISSEQYTSSLLVRIGRSTHKRNEGSNWW